MVRRASGDTLTLALGLALAACGRTPRLSLGQADAGAPDAGAPDAAAPEASLPEVSLSPTPGLDPGTVAIHRLNSREYDNTIRDLLGVEAHARDTFQPDERGYFDNDAEAFTINDARYEQYFNAAEEIAKEVFSDLGLRARVVSCAPAGPDDPACAAQSIRSFGLRAWRRPLAEAEVARLVALYAAEVAAGRSFFVAMQSVATAMLSSVGFLYRVESDLDPASTTPHAVGPYELASRLSYWVWSTMPDDELFRLAESGELSQPPVLVAQLARLLADARSEAFVDAFAGQWLGAWDVSAHQVDPMTFPQWDDSLRDSMAREIQLYFSEFLRGGRPFDHFINADVNFVDARLAQHYGMDATGLGADSVRVENRNDARKGFLGLGGFLTMTSASFHNYPRYRATWTFQQLLCDPVPFDLHPIIKVDVPPDPPPTYRQEVMAIAAQGTQCAACHLAFEPVGIGLEGFDAIGQFRSIDEKGRVIDTSGRLPTGGFFSDELQLADLLATDPRLLTCANKMLLTYALGHMVDKAYTPHLDRLMEAWKAKGLKLPALLEQIVLSEPFRFRRGEGLP